MTSAHQKLPALMAVGLAALLPLAGAADEATAQVQKDLIALGFDPGTIGGELTPQTTIAIGQYEASRGAKVSGLVTPDLASRLGADVAQLRTGQANPVAAPATSDAGATRAAQQACLQERAAANAAAAKKKRGLSRLLNVVTQTAQRNGNYELAQTTSDISAAGATADELAMAAKELGLTDDDAEACLDAR
jgi:peptidoglycan hydrolase-like protein with peptidoglycan-binding domain